MMEVMEPAGEAPPPAEHSAPCVSPCAAVAAAEAELDTAAAHDKVDAGDFRRQQLAVRAEEKEAQEARAMAAKEAKGEKTTEKKKARAKGRPRKIPEDDAADDGGAGGATESKASSSSKPKAKATKSKASSSTKRAAKEPAEGSRRKNGKGEGPNEEPTTEAVDSKPKKIRRVYKAEDYTFDKDIMSEAYKVMKKFHRVSYDKDEQTMHTPSLGCIYINRRLAEADLCKLFYAEEICRLDANCALLDSLPTCCGPELAVDPEDEDPEILLQLALQWHCSEHFLGIANGDPLGQGRQRLG